MTAVVERKLTHRAELEKYQLYVGEIDKIIALLLKVSGRLARGENAILSLTDDASEKQRVRYCEINTCMNSIEMHGYSDIGWI